MEDSIRRIEKMLAVMLMNGMKGIPQNEKALALSTAGFSSAEIASLLGTSAAVISQQLYEIRKAKGKSKSRKAIKRK